jgi:PST family polysaccharide transporter
MLNFNITSKTVWEKLRQNQVILVNFSYLSILQIFVIVCPLITYPYLLRTIGSELFGTVIFAQTIITYISLIINFGFDISATKSVAVYKENKQMLSEIVSSVYISKFVIWIICLIIYIITISTIPFFRNYFLLYFFSFFVTINELLFSVWFFQGIEKMRYSTMINILVRSLFVIAVFVIIKSKSDYLYIPLLNGIGAILAGICSIYIIFRKEHVRFLFLPVKQIYLYFKESFSLFLSIVSVKLYVSLNKIIIGTFLGMSEVAIYDLGEKIATVIKIPISMISQAVFPKIAREKNISFINRIMFLVEIFVIIGYIIVCVFSRQIVLFFMGQPSDIAVTVIRIITFSAIVMPFNIFLARNRLIPFGHYTVYMKAVMFNSLFYLCCIAGLWLVELINLYAFATLTICTELFVCLILIYQNNKLKLLINKTINSN